LFTHGKGEGAFGKVKLGVNVFTGQKVAVKVISADRARSQKDKLQLEREVGSFFPLGANL
jgi:serine/threonine protein kinase